jgi:uncharacterized protein (TIGR03790 family)
MACRRRVLQLSALMFSGLASNAGAAAASDAASTVVVLANETVPGSMAVARHYLEARGIPAENLVALPMPISETVTWQQFVAEVWEPLRQRLVDGDWIAAEAPAGRDDLGRLRREISGNRIGYLVICRGVPLRIADDPSLGERILRASLREELRRNDASVDGELALLAWSAPPASGPVVNPAYRIRDRNRNEWSRVVRVSRLDGPSDEIAMRIVDDSIAAEREGLDGRAYIDTGGPHPDGDLWLRDAAATLEARGVSTHVDRESPVFPADFPLENAAIYLGWYSGNVEGALAREGFRFRPGAIAMHIHSYSAETLRSPDARWAGPLVAHGAAATTGNVNEPFLEFTHRPDLLVEALLRGERWGDAVTYALPAFGWQAVAIGDPLYRPFGLSPSGL